jgi:predicted NUDIX family phosphoesterase
MKDEEQVLVVSRKLFDELGAFQGLRLDVAGVLPTLLAPGNNRFLRRGDAETDPSWKQLIPYFLIVHGDRVWRYVRGKQSGEERLVAKGSIGIGGHINHLDEDLFGDLYGRAADREVREEMILPEGCAHRPVALLNDDSNDVGRVHLGVVHVLRAPTPDVRKREAVITEARFLGLDELRAERDRLETWSQICLDHIEPLLAAGPPATHE